MFFLGGGSLHITVLDLDHVVQGLEVLKQKVSIEPLGPLTHRGISLIRLREGSTAFLFAKSLIFSLVNHDSLELALASERVLNEGQDVLNLFLGLLQFGLAS